MTLQPVLLEIQLSYLQLIMIPVFTIAALAGYRRGWKEEAITAVSLLFSLLFFANEGGAELVATLINRIAAAFRVFIDALFGAQVESPARPTITADNFRSFQLISFVIAVVVSYVIGSALGRRSEVTRIGKLLGGLVGVINAYIVLSKLYDFWLLREREGLDIPLDEPAQIVITPPPQTNELKGNLPTIFAILFLLVLVVTFLRLPKMRQ